MLVGQKQTTSTAVENNLAFLNLVSNQGVSLSIELLDAAHQLERLPLFAECCEFLANRIKFLSVAQVRKNLTLGEEDCKLSEICNKGI